MKYYVYISDTKINMLYEQIPVRLRDKLASELKIDLKIFSTTLSQEPAEKTRFAKLQLVTDFIHRNFDIGTIDNPNSYFQGTLTFRWGTLKPRFPNTVFFGGMTNKTIVGLAGSQKHIIGQVSTFTVDSKPNPSDFVLSSATPWILDELHDEVVKVFRQKNGRV